MCRAGDRARVILAMHLQQPLSHIVHVPGFSPHGTGMLLLVICAPL